LRVLEAEVNPDIVWACATRAEFQGFLSQIVDPAQQTAPAGDEDPSPMN